MPKSLSLLSPPFLQCRRNQPKMEELFKLSDSIPAATGWSSGISLSPRAHCARWWGPPSQPPAVVRTPPPHGRRLVRLVEGRALLELLAQGLPAVFQQLLHGVQLQAVQLRVAVGE